MSYFVDLPFDGRDTLSDAEVAIFLDHRDPMSNTVLAGSANNELCVAGAMIIRAHDSQTDIRGDDLLALADTLDCSREEFMGWLGGTPNAALDEKYQIAHNAWFEWIREDGEPVSDVFDTIHKDLDINLQYRTD